MWIEVCGWPESHIPVRQLPDMISSNDNKSNSKDCDIGLENGLGLAVKNIKKII